jgi:hypothetical protein
MFLIEVVASLVAGSVSLRADALDFLGDAANYGLALAVVGLALHWRAKAGAERGPKREILCQSSGRPTLTMMVMPSRHLRGCYSRGPVHSGLI